MGFWVAPIDTFVTESEAGLEGAGVKGNLVVFLLLARGTGWGVRRVPVPLCEAVRRARGGGGCTGKVMGPLVAVLLLMHSLAFVLSLFFFLSCWSPSDTHVY